MIPEQQKFDFSFERLCIELLASWPIFMGREIASQVAPTEIKNGVLHVVCIDDSKTLGDLASIKDEILERTNAVVQNGDGKENFLDVEFHFSKHRKIKYQSYIMGETLEDLKEVDVETGPIEGATSDELTGRFLDSMNPNSPVARCYSLFVGARRSRDALEEKKALDGAVKKNDQPDTPKSGWLPLMGGVAASVA